jgi:hypothetical protein
MRKLLLLAALLFAASSAIAGNVDLTTAQSKAANFLRTKAAHGRLMTSAPAIKWTHEVKTSGIAQAAYYIVNTDKGYVIVAGDDRAREILAYGEGSLKSVNDLPEATQYFLDIYQKQMEYLQAHPGLMPQKLTTNRGISVEPLLQTAWNQGKPYNMKTPRKGYGSDPYCKVGCAAVALAQVMNFWKYPVSSPALPGYTTETHGYVMDPLPEYTFDYEHLLNSYRTNTDQYTDVQLDAIGYLMLYTGYAMNMDYATDQSGAEYDEIDQAIRTFGFDPGFSIEMKWDYDDGTVNYTEEQWATLIQTELAAGRPLVYCAFDMSSDSTGIGGHAFNVDGYDAANDLYHVNFGMSADKNTYYALNAFTLDNGMTVYDFYPLLFAGLQPPGLTNDPRIGINTSSLNMECYVGETDTATFNVTGINLIDDITLTLTDENGAFSLDATTISKDDAGNATVTVIYAPQAVGNHTAKVTLTSTDANEATVTLHGTATNAPLVVYDPVMLPADSTHIALTSFRADWTDQTPAQNVLSYTLQVNQKPTSGLISEADWSNVPSSGNAANYMPEGWTYNGGVYLEGGRISISSGYSLYSNTLDLTGFDKITVVVRGKNCYTWTNSAISVKTSVDSKYQEFATDYADYTFVLNCSSSERVEIYSESYYPEIQSVKIYAGEYEPQLRATEEGNETYREITGITDKFYTVNNLLAEGTFLYKVKALYTDGTESAWSNTQMVTLFDNGPAPHEYAVGDVNHDKSVNIADVTALIDYLLGTGEICQVCADVNQDNAINIADVTSLIDKLLSN